MTTHKWLGVKWDDGVTISVVRTDHLDDWINHEFTPDRAYFNTIWMLSKGQTDQALLLLSLGMGKDEIEEILNAKPINN